MTWARLAFRLQRSSIGFATAVCLGLAALGAWLASMPASCDTSTRMDPCGTVYLFGSPMGDPALLFYLGIGVAMYVVPVVLGAPVLPSEVERRTAMIAWPLARSRTMWLAWRAGPVLVSGLALVGLMAVAGEALARAKVPEGGELGFAYHGSRGISLVTRAAVMLVVAVAVGAVIGKVLPSLLVGGALALGLSVVLQALPPYGVEPTELTAAEANGYPMTTGHEYRAADGMPISEDEANAISQAAYAEYSPDFPPDSVLPYSVSYGIAGSRYGEVLARESAMLIGASVLAGAAAAAVVQRRRPE